MLTILILVYLSGFGYVLFIALAERFLNPFSPKYPLWEYFAVAALWPLILWKAMSK